MNLLLRPPGMFRALMLNPERLRESLEDFFVLSERPTPAALAAHLGTTVAKLRSIFMDPMDTMLEYSEESAELVAAAMSNIEAYLTDGGLTEALHPSFTKFVLSSSFNRNERTESDSTAITRLEVSFSGGNAPPSEADIIEMDRLRSLTSANTGQLTFVPAEEAVSV